MLSPASYQHLRFEGRAPAERAASRVARPSREGAVPTADRRPPEPALADDERQLIEAALRTAGLDAAAYRAGPFRRRMPAVLRSLQVRDARLAAQAVGAREELARRALDALLIGHTEPFRNAETFCELRSNVLPALAAGRDGLRVWSVGCSWGIELLSAALLLAERELLGGSRLRGSDCRATAIAAARGLAVERLLAALPAAFDELRRWAVQPEFGAAVARIDWVVEDALTAAAATSTWDLIFSRNLAIYLDQLSSQRLWERLVAALAPGGVLVTGRAERPLATLPLERVAKCIYRIPAGRS